MESTKTISTELFKALIEEFNVTYNDIAKYLRHFLHQGKQVSFAHLIDLYVEKRPSWKDAKQLRKYAELRNFLEHEQTTIEEVITFPTQATIDDIKSIRDRLIKDKKALDVFVGKVETFGPHDGLLSVLESMRKNDFSQFPVWGDNCIQGLLTSNGIARWLAHKGLGDLSITGLGAILVEDVLMLEEERKNYELVNREAEVGAVEDKFIKNSFLEAVIVNHGGVKKDRPLAIVTRWDLWENGRS